MAYEVQTYEQLEANHKGTVSGRVFRIIKSELENITSRDDLTPRQAASAQVHYLDDVNHVLNEATFVLGDKPKILPQDLVKELKFNAECMRTSRASGSDLSRATNLEYLAATLEAVYQERPKKKK